MHILLLAPDLGGKSGWSRYALDLGKALARRGHTITAVVSGKTGADWCTEVALLWYDMRYLHHPLLATWSAWRLRSLIRRLKPDVVHAMCEPYAMLLPLLDRGTKTCMTIHGTYSVVPLVMNERMRKRFEKAYERADRIFSVSDFTKMHLQEQFPALYEKEHFEEKIHVLKNGLDLSSIPYEPKKKQNDTHRMIGVGAVKERKGYMHAVTACAAFRDMHPEIPFIYEIFGSRDQRPAYVSLLESRIKELKLEDRVFLRGRVSDRELQEAYANADLFLLLSIADAHYFEGFGLVFLEAASRGIPVIGPKSGGCPEAIKEGKSGYIVEPTDAHTAAKRMEDILLKQTIDTADCRAWAEQNDIGKAAEKLEKEYRALVS